MDPHVWMKHAVVSWMSITWINSCNIISISLITQCTMYAIKIRPNETTYQYNIAKNIPTDFQTIPKHPSHCPTPHYQSFNNHYHSTNSLTTPPRSHPTIRKTSPGSSLKAFIITYKLFNSHPPPPSSKKLPHRGWCIKVRTAPGAYPQPPRPIKETPLEAAIRILLWGCGGSCIWHDCIGVRVMV